MCTITADYFGSDDSPAVRFCTTSSIVESTVPAPFCRTNSYIRHLSPFRFPRGDRARADDETLPRKTNCPRIKSHEPSLVQGVMRCSGELLSQLVGTSAYIRSKLPAAAGIKLMLKPPVQQ